MYKHYKSLVLVVFSAPLGGRWPSKSSRSFPKGSPYAQTFKIPVASGVFSPTPFFFLVLEELYAKFVKDFATNIFEIRQLLKNSNLNGVACFDHSKDEISNAIPLPGFDPCAKTIFTTDVSVKGLTVVLSHIDKNAHKVTISCALCSVFC